MLEQVRWREKIIIEQFISQQHILKFNIIIQEKQLLFISIKNYLRYILATSGDNTKYFYSEVKHVNGLLATTVFLSSRQILHGKSLFLKDSMKYTMRIFLGT